MEGEGRGWKMEGEGKGRGEGIEGRGRGEGWRLGGEGMGGDGDGGGGGWKIGVHGVSSLGFSVSGCKPPLPLSPRAQPLGLAGRGWLAPHVRKGSPRARAACPPALSRGPDLPSEANGWLRL